VQYLEFVTPDPYEAPQVLSVVKQSPEQYKITFDQSLRNSLDPSNVTFEYLVNGSYPIGGGLQVVGQEETDKTVYLTRLNGKQYLLELNADWTVIRDTPNTGISYYTAGNNEVRISIQSNPNHKIENKFESEMQGRDTRRIGPIEYDGRYATDSPFVENILYTEPDLLNLHPNGLVTVNMNEPVQINVGTVKTVPLSPSTDQMDGASSVTYDVDANPYISAGDKSDAIPVSRFSFVRLVNGAAVGVTIPGEVRTVDEEDKVITVEPADDLRDHGYGSWMMSYAAVSDDVENTNTSGSVEFEVVPPEDTPTDDRPFVLWTTVYDNIYAYRTDGTPQLSDVVYIQYSKPMDGSAFLPYMYLVNDYPVNEINNGANIFKETDSLVKITFPYYFLTDFTQSVNDAVNSQPYVPKDGHTVTVSPNVKDQYGNLLAGPNQLATTYTHNNNLATITPHVTALVNANTRIGAVGGFNNRKDIAYLDDAVTVAASYVKTIEPMRPYNLYYYDATTGNLNGTPALPANIAKTEPVTIYSREALDGGTVVANATTSFTVDAELASDFTLTANLAAITLNKPVTGDVILNSSNGPSVAVNGDVTGDVTITAAEAASVNIVGDVTGDIASIDADKANITISGDVTAMTSVTIDSDEGAKVVINGDVTSPITTITAHEAKIEVNGKVDGDATINSNNGTDVWIRGEVTGVLTVNVPNATVHVLPGTNVAPGSTYDVVVEDVASGTLVIGADANIVNLTIGAGLDHAFTIKYLGEVTGVLTINSVGTPDNIKVLIQSNGSTVQEGLALAKFNALKALVSGGINDNRLKFATATSLLPL
jgi:hypothetical protein